MPDKYEITVKNPVAGISANLVGEGSIDLIGDFSHDMVTKFTDVPLEDGSSVVDHAVDSPLRLRLSIIVSNLHTQTELTEEYSGLDFSDMVATGSAGFTPRQLIDAANDELSGRQRRLIDGTLTAAESQSDVAFNALISQAVQDSILNQIRVDSGEIEKGRPQATLADLVKLKSERSLLTISSLLASYDNMVIEKISVRETFATGTSLQANIELRQITFAVPVTTIVRTRALNLGKMTPQQARDEVIAQNRALEEKRAREVAEKKAAKEAADNEARKIHERKFVTIVKNVPKDFIEGLKIFAGDLD
jgi:hypothetical protein